MAEPVTFAVLQAIRDQLAVITTATGYSTNMGLSLRLNDSQRAADDASIAIGSISGTLNLRNETGKDGRAKSPRARRLAITIEASSPVVMEDEEHTAHLMLEDIERAFEVDSRLLPFSVGELTLDTWTILPRAEGSAAVVLQILGSADYIRPQT